MSHLATVLAAIASGPTAQTLLELLERKGYRGFLVHGRAEAEAVIRDRQPDLILIGPSLADADGLDFARALKADPVTAGVPLFLLAEELNESFCRSALDIGVEDAMRLPIDEGALLARMRTLARITTMHTELRLRAAVARGMGIAVRDEVSAPPADGAPSLMMLGRPENRDFLREALGDGAEIVATNDPFEADALVEGRMFDAAVLFADGSPASCLDLCAHMRNNVRLFNLPVVLAMTEGGVTDPALPYAQGASSVLLLPTSPIRMRAAIVPLVRRQRLRWAIRQALSDSLAPPSKCPPTDAYNVDFLMSYLAKRLALVQARNQPLSVAMFYVPSVSGIRERFGVAAEGHFLSQIGHWIGGLLRAEDLCAYLGNNEFCVALPDTPIGEAQIVMQRIAGVLSHTDFAVPDVYEVVRAWVQVGGDETGPYDTPDSIVRRARRMLG